MAPAQPSPALATQAKRPRYPKGRDHVYLAAPYRENSDLAKTINLGLRSTTITPNETLNPKSPTGSNPANAKADTTTKTPAAAYTAAREQTRRLRDIPKTATYDGARESGGVSNIGVPFTTQTRTASASASASRPTTTLQSPFHSPSKTNRSAGNKKSRSFYDKRESAKSDSGSGSEDEDEFSDVESDGVSVVGGRST